MGRRHCCLHALFAYSVYILKRKPFTRTQVHEEQCSILVVELHIGDSRVNPIDWSFMTFEY